MKTELLKEQVYSSILTILNDPKCYYTSNVDYNNNYFYAVGKAALVEWIELVAPKILEIEDARLEQRAKDHVWTKIKDE